MCVSVRVSVRGGAVLVLLVGHGDGKASGGDDVISAIPPIQPAEGLLAHSISQNALDHNTIKSNAGLQFSK